MYDVCRERKRLAEAGLAIKRGATRRLQTAVIRKIQRTYRLHRLRQLSAAARADEERAEEAEVRAIYDSRGVSEPAGCESARPVETYAATVIQATFRAYQARMFYLRARRAKAVRDVCALIEQIDLEATISGSLVGPRAAAAAVSAARKLDDAFTARGARLADKVSDLLLTATGPAMGAATDVINLLYVAADNPGRAPDSDPYGGGAFRPGTSDSLGMLGTLPEDSLHSESSLGDDHSFDGRGSSTMDMLPLSTPAVPRPKLVIAQPGESAALFRRRQAEALKAALNQLRAMLVTQQATAKRDKFSTGIVRPKPIAEEDDEDFLGTPGDGGGVDIVEAADMHVEQQADDAAGDKGDAEVDKALFGQETAADKLPVDLAVDMPDAAGAASASALAAIVAALPPARIRAESAFQKPALQVTAATMASPMVVAKPALPSTGRLSASSSGIGRMLGTAASGVWNALGASRARLSAQRVHSAGSRDDPRDRAGTDDGSRFHEPEEPPPLPPHERYLQGLMTLPEMIHHFLEQHDK